MHRYLAPAIPFFLGVVLNLSGYQNPILAAALWVVTGILVEWLYVPPATTWLITKMPHVSRRVSKLITMSIMSIVGLVVVIPVFVGLRKGELVEQADFKERPETTVFSLTERGMVFECSIDQLEKHGWQLPAFEGISPGTLYSKNGVLYVDTVVMDAAGGPAIKIVKNEFTVKPADWDKNFTADAFEVVNGQGLPVFQLIRKGLGRIVMFGIFYGNNGQLLIADEYGVRSGIYANVRQFKPKPIFKYPAWKFRGKYADGSN